MSLNRVSVPEIFEVVLPNADFSRLYVSRFSRGAPEPISNTSNLTPHLNPSPLDQPISRFDVSTFESCMTYPGTQEDRREGILALLYLAPSFKDLSTAKTLQAL